MILERLGELLQHWHASMDDPIYAVGSFFFSGKDYPDPNVVVAARDAIQSDISGKKFTKAAEQRELRTILRGLDLYIRTRGITLESRMWYEATATAKQLNSLARDEYSAEFMLPVALKLGRVVADLAELRQLLADGVVDVEGKLKRPALELVKS
jgi:hypothetical protein